MRKVLSSIVLLAGLAVRAALWFDAGVERLALWPTDGSLFPILGVGAWSGTESSTLGQDEGGASRILFGSSERHPLEFAADVVRSVKDGPTVSFTIRFDRGQDLQTVNPEMKGALTVVGMPDSTPVYYGLVKDGAANAWVPLMGAVPDLTRDVRVDICLRDVGEVHQVRYVVDGVPLRAADAGEWAEIVFPRGSSAIGAMGCYGTGELAALSGSTEAVPEKVVLSIPEPVEWTVTGVSAGGYPLAAVSEGVYDVPRGEPVVVAFRAADGYFLDRSEMVVALDRSGELPEAGRPVAMPARGNLRISEVMASNGETIRTRAGQGGLDWVEIQNVSDFDADLSGWCLHDNPADKPKKWTRIEGRCVVPAHGHALVWADKDYTGFLPDEAYARMGLSSDGESVLLATPDGDIVDQVDFGLQLTDVSFGVGSLTRALAYFRNPTPGAPNAASGLTGPTPEVTFSEPHGWKTGPISVALECPGDSQAKIYYTTNGTSPTTRSMPYRDPIPISSTTCIRAAVPDADSVLQRDTSATYLFVEDVLRQPTSTPAGFPASESVNGQRLRYGMNASIVSSERARILSGFTNGISTLSVVIDPANLFDSGHGIYVNATGNGRAWERPTLLEQICPTNAAQGFSAPAGIRIRGAFSRAARFPKHSFRFFFRGEYGRGKLEHPLFGDEGAAAYDVIDLRSAQNNSWANFEENAQAARAFTFIEECFSRDSQRDLGEPYHRSRYCHLFINGVYWGVYQTEERTNGDYGASYFGGKAEDYDVVRTSQPGYVTSVVEGDSQSWSQFWGLSVNEGYGASHSNNYKRAMGLNPDGTRNPRYPVYLNPTNVMVHMLTAHFAADKDAPAAAGMANNMAALYNRVAGLDVAETGARKGWIFNRHDAEHSLGVCDTYVTDNLLTYGTEAANAAFRQLANFNPSELHYRLCENAEYRMAFADLVFRACLKEDGALTPRVAKARFRSRMDELDDAVACESARWGGPSYTRATWLSACDICLSFIEGRLNHLIPQYRAQGWYPSCDAPRVVDGRGVPVLGGTPVADGTKVFLSAKTAGTVYYTTDGSDPRAEGGAVSGSARAYAATDGLEVPGEGLSIRARLLSSSGEWSALEAVDIPTATTLADGLRVAEVMSSTADGSGDGAEFIVLTNRLPDVALDLGGVRIVSTKTGAASPSLELVLPDGLTLPASGSLTLTKDVHWPEAKITNGAVDMTVEDARGGVVQRLHFEASWWGKACDETGASFRALAFGTAVVEIDQWEPSFVPPATGSAGQKGIAKAVKADDRVRVWLNGLARTAAGAEAIASFTGDKDALRACYLVDAPPEENPEIEVDIPSVSLDADGTPVLGGRLRTHGVEAGRTVNGAIRLYHAPTLEDLPLAESFIPFGNSFPVVPRRAETPSAPSRFFQLRVE